MSLEEKLKEIVLEDYGVVDADYAVAQIISVFREEGWLELSSVTPETQAAIANITLGNYVLTGQEWLERFTKEFETALREGDPEGATYKIEDITYLDDFGATDILDIAKRASNLEKES